MSKAKVIEAKFGDFEVKFHSPEAPKTRGHKKTQVEISQTQLSPKEMAEIESESLEVNEALLRQEQVETMMISDPLEYEKELMHGEELVDGAEEDPRP